MKWVTFTLLSSLNLNDFHPLIDLVFQRVPQLKRPGLNVLLFSGSGPSPIFRTRRWLVRLGDCG